MGRAPSGEGKEGFKKGAWTAEEDEKLVSFIQRNKGHGSWRTLPELAGLERCGKSCRLRWTNYLRPNIKRGNFSAEEERIIIQLHAFMGNKWSSIASHLPGRTDNEVKNHWNSHLKKRLAKMGIDPTTHLPLQFIMQQDAANYYRNHYQSSFHNMDYWKMALLQRSLQQDPTIACQLVEWELARLEAETRMQIAVNSHEHMQKYVSWLQSLQRNEAPAYNSNEFMFMHAFINQQLQLDTLTLTASTSSLENTRDPFQPPQDKDDQLLKQLTPWGNEENQRLASSILHNQSSSSNGGVPHANEGPVYTASACNMAALEACSSESTLCDQLQLPALLSSTDQMMPSPSLDELHDPYWNKMLNLLSLDV